MTITVSKTKNGYMISRVDHSRAAVSYESIRVVEGFEVWDLATAISAELDDKQGCRCGQA